MSAVLDNTTADSARARLTLGTGLPQPYSVQIALLGRIAPAWRIVQPLLVTIERGDESFIASDDLFAMYGLGDDPAEALEDYMAVLTEYYEVLSSHRDEPSVGLFRRLQGYVQPVGR